mmetsp:Transcript_38504/g.114265  ORF Transcript_38504/g.114265 Transcript_38504/m.114265 type:complete len:94 (-) Transcript_38504:307-588(-)
MDVSGGVERPVYPSTPPPCLAHTPASTTTGLPSHLPLQLWWLATPSVDCRLAGRMLGVSFWRVRGCPATRAERSCLFHDCNVGCLQEALALGV